jgi:F420-0:gamma-glutamyl ligase-like protein
MREAKACGLVDAVLVDGSLVTATPEPNDIDLVLVVPSSYNLSVDLSPVDYNLLSHNRVRRRFGFDIVVVKNDSDNLEQAIAFFQQVKQRPGMRKGILRIKL